jgi:hypothetical protein
VDELTFNNPEPSPQPIPEPPAPQRNLRGIFVGENGIRAGWGILLFIVIIVACGFSIGFIAKHFVHPHHPSNPEMSAHMGVIFEGLQLLCIVIATGVLALIEHKSLFAYGFQGAARAARFFWGLVWGFVALSSLVLVLWKTGYLAFDGQLLHGSGHIVRYAAEWGLMFLLVGLSEESLTRGYLQFTLTRGIGFWWGALLMSFLFGFGHHSNPGESPVGLFSAGAIGLVFCLSLWYTGSLWWAVGFHAAWDWGQSFFYGTRDSGLIVRGHLFGEHPVGKLLWSGGDTGPEGSIYIIPLIIIIALAMWLWWGRRVQSPFAGSAWRPAWSRKPRLSEPTNLAPGPIEAAS